MENGWMRLGREDFENGKPYKPNENYRARVQYQLGWSKAQDSNESIAKRGEALLANDPEYRALDAECKAMGIN